MNATISFFTQGSPFNAIEEFKGEYRCIASDLRTATGGQSSCPLEIDRPWDSFTDDQLGLMDHLGIQKFMVMGFCIGGPFIWNVLRRAPDRVVAAVLAQPSGWRPELPNLSYETNMTGWGPEFVKHRPGVSACLDGGVHGVSIATALAASGMIERQRAAGGNSVVMLYNIARKSPQKLEDSQPSGRKPSWTESRSRRPYACCRFHFALNGSTSPRQEFPGLPMGSRT